MLNERCECIGMYVFCACVNVTFLTISTLRSHTGFLIISNSLRYSAIPFIHELLRFGNNNIHECRKKKVYIFDKNALKNVEIYAIGGLSNKILDKFKNAQNTGGSKTMIRVGSGSTYEKTANA